jgi:integrase
MTFSPTPTTATLPAESFADPFVGLTETDATRIAAAMTAAITESTRIVYGHTWRRWERWCAGRAITPLPAAPAAVCAYLTERAAEGASAAVVDTSCSAISYVHRSSGLDDPILCEAVRQVRRGLRRTLGTAPQRQARPLGLDEIRRIVTPIDRTTAKGMRDAALILVGFASALRRSELTALTLADVETRPAGVLLHVRRSKTDPEGHGQVVGVAHGQHALTDPVAALAAWSEARGLGPGPLFVSLRNKVLTDEPISGEAVARMLRTRARAAGISTERITGHSLRAGHATSAAAAGVPLERIALQTRHKRISTLIERYIRPAQALEVTSSRDLGL